jgi:hypothetical protein
MNKVQLIRSRFEKLNSNSSEITDALDITPLRVKREPQLKFSRSATCIDFTKFRLSEVKKDPVNSPKTPEPVKTKPQFQRQLSNSSNTSQKSIRRSPAFRFDAQCRPSILKNITKEDPAKRKIEIDKELEYLTSSATIKKALMKPLPKGSPPKKPPRMFLSPQFGQKESSPTFQSRLQKLKISPNTLPKKTAAKTEDKKAISSFLNCIISPCSIDPIYYEQIRQEQSQKREEPEQIYMEPYAHLHKDFQSNSKSPKANEELHYMCTVLDPDMNGNMSSSSQEPDDLRRSSLEASDIEDYEKVRFRIDNELIGDIEAIWEMKQFRK